MELGVRRRGRERGQVGTQLVPEREVRPTVVDRRQPLRRGLVLVQRTQDEVILQRLDGG